MTDWAIAIIVVCSIVMFLCIAAIAVLFIFSQADKAGKADSSINEGSNFEPVKDSNVELNAENNADEPIAEIESENEAAATMDRDSDEDSYI